MFKEYPFMITACSVYEALFLDGIKNYKVAYVNCKRIIDEFREELKSLRIFFIDWCSFFSIADLENLDKK